MVNSKMWEGYREWFERWYKMRSGWGFKDNKQPEMEKNI